MAGKPGHLRGGESNNYGKKNKTDRRTGVKAVDRLENLKKNLHIKLLVKKMKSLVPLGLKDTGSFQEEWEGTENSNE